jgi:hypothetical protein
MSLTVTSKAAAVTITRPTVAGTATLLVAADPTRIALLVVNNNTGVLDVGSSAVAVGTGIPVPAGGSLRISAEDGAAGAWYAAYSGGGGDVGVASSVANGMA